MKIKTISQIENTERDVQFTGGNSLRLLLASDGMGYAFMKTMIKKGGPYVWHYPEHMESCFCIEGKAILKDLLTNEEYSIVPDTIYILNKDEKHSFFALEDTIIISVFNPPLCGEETHNKDGKYELDISSNRAMAEKITRELIGSKNYYDAVESVQDILNFKK